MKTKRFLLFAVSLFAFFLLFYRQTPGINVGIFALLFSAIYTLVNPLAWKYAFHRTVHLCFLFSTVGFSINGSKWMFPVMLVCYIQMVSLMFQSELRSVLTGFRLFPVTYGKAAFSAITLLLKPLGFIKPVAQMRMLVRVGLVPAVLLPVFWMLYSAGSEEFNGKLAGVFSGLEKLLASAGANMNWAAFRVLLIGLFISLIVFLEKKAIALKRVTEQLERVRKKRGHFTLGLKYEYLGALILFSALNLSLGYFLILEISHHWFRFSWNGEFLKDFVHQGTYILIFSIVLSIAVSLYYFRANLNFYPDQRYLKLLLAVWVVLNGLLVISVAIRNIYYIQHFALAHKRIAVFFFLFLCITGLLSLLIKVFRRKKLQYVLRVNAMALLLLASLSSFVNWDRIIARYNLAHADRAFLHLSYLIGLDNDALPLLYLSEEEMKRIEQWQLAAIPFANPGYFEEVNYRNRLEVRTENYREWLVKTHWLSKTMADHRAERHWSQKRQGLKKSES